MRVYDAALQVNFLRWNARFFRLNFANGSLEYQEQEGRGEFYGELFFSQDSAVEKQGAFQKKGLYCCGRFGLSFIEFSLGITFKLSGTPNRKNHGQKMIYYLRAASQPEADRWGTQIASVLLRCAASRESDTPLFLRRWVENLKKLIDEVKRRPVPPKKPAHLGGGQ